MQDVKPITWHTGPLSTDIESDLAHARPANPVSEAPLASLIDIQSLRTLLDDLTQLVGMPTALLDQIGRAHV